MDGVEIRLLGPFQLSKDGQPIKLPVGRLRSLLAALALSPGRPVRLERLVECLWGADGAPLTARQVLQNTVWRLRKVDAAPVVVDGEAYLLDVPPEAVDVTRFNQALDRAAAADTDAAERQALTEAVALWRGEPLSGVDSEVLQRDLVPTLTERYLTAVERRIDIDLAGSVPDGLVAELRALTGQHPLRESLWLQLMTVLGRSGRDAEALAAYEQLRVTLADQLGADPSAAVRELHQQLLTGEFPRHTADDLTGDAGVAPESGYEVPRQLPAEASGFVGRAHELAALDKLLTQHGRPATATVVHGPGGVGKTALAVRWAHTVAHRFPDGQFYLDLRGYGTDEPTSSHQALGILLRTSGVAPRSLPQQPDERVAMWRTRVAGRRVLLLLDNARSADQVRPLLPGGDSAVLVTSRSQLRGLRSRDGASSVPLRELDGTEARDLLAETVGAERIAAEAGAAAELSELCGGLPLALRIIADQAQRHPEAGLAELAADLRAHRLEALSDPDDPTADPRTVFSWSYRGLEPESARLFRLLSLHPGSDVSLPAAAALTGDSPAVARRLLDRLVSVHLLEATAVGRYRLHDLLRAYAAEQVLAETEPDERQAVTRRILDWYLQSANQANRALKLGPPLDVLAPADSDLEPIRFADNSQALAWFHAELPTVVSVVQYAGDHGFPVHAYQIAWVLAAPCELTGRLDEWLPMAEASYRSAQSLDNVAKYRATHGMGVVLNYLGRLSEAERYKREALRHAQDGDNPKSVVSALNSLGSLRMSQGQWLAALEYWHEALGIARANDLGFQAAHCLLNIGAEEANHGRYDDGIRHGEEALAAYQELDATFHQGMALSNLADAYARAGRLQQALECCDRATEVLSRTEGTVPVTFAMEMASIYARADRPDQARALLRRSIDGLHGSDHPKLAEARQALARLKTPDGVAVR
ncbi:MAG: BTAD domain-containing putative transcriptional regulator [Micromonosporaceae bacterium]